MTCVHLRQLYDLCDREGVRMSSSDLIHIVCRQCGKQEVCPSNLSDHWQDDPEAGEPASHETDAQSGA
jgi:hypothetical protein